jgi:hypothetical protein
VVGHDVFIQRDPVVGRFDVVVPLVKVRKQLAQKIGDSLRCRARLHKRFQLCIQSTAVVFFSIAVVASSNDCR